VVVLSLVLVVVGLVLVVVAAVLVVVAAVLVVVAAAGPAIKKIVAPVERTAGKTICRCDNKKHTLLSFFSCAG
jgi:hypothetical protein